MQILLIFIFIVVYTSSVVTSRRSSQSAFALPTVLITSVVMLMVLLTGLTSATSVNTSLREQYLNKVLEEAGESGLMKASECHSGGTLWGTSSNPLTPYTDCAGLRQSGCSSAANAACNYVLNSGNIRTSFRVEAPVAVNASNYRFSVTATLEQIKASTAGSSNPTVVSTKSASSYQIVSYGLLPPIKSGNQTYCAISGGKAYCWGNNNNGQVGVGSTDATINTPTMVKGLLSDRTVYDIATGFYHTCAIAGTTAQPTPGNGAIYCWGLNQFGQFGNGTTSATPVTAPVQTVPASYFTGGPWALTSIGGRDNTCVLLDSNVAGDVAGDTKVHCWGRNDYGQSGDNASGSACVDSYTCMLDPKTEPTQQPVRMSNGSIFSSVNSIGTQAFRHGCLINGYSTRTLYCWGTNGLGQLGGTSVNPSSRGYAASSLTEPVEVETNRNAACALTGYATTSKKIFCWGSNGTGAPDYRNDNVNVQRLDPPIDMSRNAASTAAIKVNTSTDYITSFAIADYSSCFVKSTGKIYCWGYNDKGQLARTPDGPAYVGNNTPTISGSGTSMRPLPPQSAVEVILPGTLKAVNIAATEASFCVVTDRASTYCWGRNEFGELGIGTTSTDKTCRCESSPQRVSLPTTRILY